MPQGLSSILGKPNRVRKPARPTQARRGTSSSPSPRKGRQAKGERERERERELEAAFPDKLADVGAARLLAEELTLRDVVQAMRYIRSSMFSPVPHRGLHSTRVAELLNYRASMPAVVTQGHLNAVLPSATKTERELAELVGKGVLRKVRVERRGGLGEAVIETAELEALMRRSGAAAGAAEALLALLRRHPTSHELPAGVLSGAQTDELVRAGFLASSTGAAPGGGRLDARPEDRTTLTSVERVSRFASGTVSAVGGRHAVHLAGGGGGGGTAAAAAAAAAGDGAEPAPSGFRLSLPGLGRHLRLGEAAVDWLREALGRTRWGEAPEGWLRERFEAGGLAGARWRAFRGLEWEWAVGLAVGLGVAEVFETGAVGRGVRALG